LPVVPGTGRALDGLSVAINAGAFAALVLGAEAVIGAPALAAALVAAATLGVVALVRREMPKAAPLIPVDLLRSDSFRISVIASVCCFAGVTMGLLALPFYLQHALGQGTLTAGLYMTPWPLMVALAAPAAGRLADRMSTAALCAAGGACLAVGLAAASLWPLNGDPLPLVPITMLCGVGFGLFQVPNNRNMFLAAPLERSGAAGGMQGTARLAGQTAGSVMTGLLFSTLSMDAAPRLGLGIGAVLASAAAVASVLRTNTEARTC
jgi:DHA2 family multidrug resistance protein-like MFS transporter